MNILKFLYIFIYFVLVNSYPIKLESFSEIEIKQGNFEYFYEYSHYILNHNEKTPYIYIKSFNLNKIDFSVYLNDEEVFNSHIDILQNDGWIKFPMNNKNKANITLIINSYEPKLKMIFIDSSKILKINLEKFLYLNLTINKIYELPFPFIFNITVNKNIFLSIQDEARKNYLTLNDSNVLNYCLIKNNKECNYIKADNIQLKKNETYLFKLNYKKEKNVYFFRKFKINYFIEEINFGNNSFISYNFTQNYYLLLNIQNYSNLYFYINDNSNIFNRNHNYSIISKQHFNSLLYKKNKFYMDKSLINGKITPLENLTKNSNYLLININNTKINQGFIIIYSELYLIKDQFWSKEIKKGRHVLIYIYNNYNSKVILSSSNKNMKLYLSKEDFTYKLFLRNHKENIIYINSSQDNTKFICNFYNETISNFYNINLIKDDDFKDKNFIFFRTISKHFEQEFNSFYFFDINEKYYVYIKKYYGESNVYKYNKPLDIFSCIQNYMKPISYYDKNIYDIVNDELLIISGTQFFNIYLNSGTFFDFLLQKVDDSEYIENTHKSFAKILNANKTYKFEYLNHLIILDNNYLDAEIIISNKEGIKGILNNTNRKIFIEDVYYFTIKSNRLSLVYFYKRFPDHMKFNNNNMIIFDKSQKGKNMKIKINIKTKLKEIYILKDFGLINYYPMRTILDVEQLNIDQSKTIYIENYYDLMENKSINISGDELFIIYLLEDNDEYFGHVPIDTKNFQISRPIYYDSLTKINEFNINVIPKRDNNFFIKPIYKNYSMIYQFIKCSEDNIYFNLDVITANKIENKTNYNINTDMYIITDNIINNRLDKDQILIHNFTSKNEFLFLYDFYNTEDKDNNNIEIPLYKTYEIKYIKSVNGNKINIYFEPAFKTYAEYYIIISKKNNINNLNSFKNPCFIAKLINNNSNDIYIKKVFHSNEILIKEDFDLNIINQIIKNENDDYVINIISINLFPTKFFYMYTPVIYNNKIKNKNEIKLKIFDNIYFNPEKDYFSYEHLMEEKLVLYTDIYQKEFNDLLIILTDENSNNKTFYFYKNSMNEIIFEKKGKYFFEFYFLKNKKNEDWAYFRSYSFNKKIDEIDLSKNYYSGYFYYTLNDKNKFQDLAYYKITNLVEDKKVFFSFDNELNKYLKKYEINSPFIICEIEKENSNDKCVKNVYSYNFIKGKKYKIYIKLLLIPKYLWKYYFIPVFENTIQNISEIGQYNIDFPKIFNLEITNKELYFNIFNIKFNFVFSNDNEENISNINSYIFNEINTYSFILGKNSKNKKLIFIPENNDKLNQIFITNKKCEYEILDKIEIKKGENCLIKLNYDFNSLYNYLEIFNSPLKNMKLVFTSNKPPNNIYQNLIINQFGNNYLYINISENDVNIIKNKYEQKYLFFSILNDETLENFISFIESKNIYMNKRINTDQLFIDDLFNIYIDTFDKKYNLYIKKYYGEIKIYESDYKLNDIKNDINILTKPIKHLQNKKSIFNRLIQLNKNILITGYLSPNSFLDFYFEEDNENKDIYLSQFKNRKYLKKGIEYHFHFYLNHLIKLESQFNAEITIYNQNTTIILNNKNQTGILKGNDYKIKSNKNAMVYFYPKTEKFQKKIYQDI